MKIINPELAHSIREQGMLKPANKFGYIYLGCEIELPKLFKCDSDKKKKVIKKLKSHCALLKNTSDNIKRADVFTAITIPPGTDEGRKLIQEKKLTVHIAKFDLVILIECKTVQDIKSVQELEQYKVITNTMQQESKYFYKMAAKNANRIDEVDKTKQGVFLFNYFYAEDTQTILDVWEYTAGWWTAKANLTNSTPLQPITDDFQYALINHCRWNNLFEVLPALIFKPSMKKFVLKNFTENNIVAMPILYKLA